MHILLQAGSSRTRTANQNQLPYHKDSATFSYPKNSTTGRYFVTQLERDHRGSVHHPEKYTIGVSTVHMIFQYCIDVQNILDL